MRQLTHQKEIVDMWAACLHAGTKQHMKGITAPPRMIRLCPVGKARSTVKPRRRKRTVSANPCFFSHRHAVGDKQITNVNGNGQNGCAPPTVSNGAATTREARMKPHAHGENHTARNQTVDAQVRINKMHDRRHLFTHMMPATI